MGALAIYPETLPPAALGQQYLTKDQPLTAVGGVGTVTFSITSGALPPGLTLNTSIAGQAYIEGQPRVADCYGYTPTTVLPYVKNPSTFTITATDSSSPPQTASNEYTIPVGVFSEDHAISIYEMLNAVYGTDWYIVMSDLGTRMIRIGDLGSPAFGGLRLMVNCYLNKMTPGMIKRLKGYIKTFDEIKLIAQKQQGGNIGPITGIDMDWERKLQKLLGLVKTCLPALTRAEVEAREAHHGGSDSTGSVAGGNRGGFEFVR